MQSLSYIHGFAFLCAIASLLGECGYDEQASEMGEVIQNVFEEETAAEEGVMALYTTLFNEIGELPTTNLTDYEYWLTSPELQGVFYDVDQQFLSDFSSRLAFEGTVLGNVRLLELDEELGSGSIVEKIQELDYLNDATISISGSTIEEDEDGVVMWEADLEGVSWQGNALFAIDGDKVVGTITTDQGIDYSVEPIRSETRKLHALIPTWTNLILLDHPPGYEAIPFETSILDTNSLQENEDESTRLDITIGYTPKVARGMDAIELHVKQMLKFSETPFRNSGINLSLKLAVLEGVEYVEGDSLQEDLTALKNGEGVLNNLHEIRDQSSGDILALALFGRGGCGLAESIRANKKDAIFVFHYIDECIRLNYVISHEIGHLLGAAHNIEAGEKHRNQHYGYGQGFLDATNGWGTIMSLSNQDCVNNGCTRAPCFSSPTPCDWITSLGLIMGENTDNARVIRENLTRVASFY